MMLRRSLMIFIYVLLVLHVNASAQESCNEWHNESDQGITYRGCQNEHRETGNCVTWEYARNNVDVANDRYNNAWFSDPDHTINAGSGLGKHNYCRNPKGLLRDDIWCWNEEGNWDFCKPVSATISIKMKDFDNPAFPAVEKYMKVCDYGKNTGLAVSSANGECEQFYFRDVVNPKGERTGAYNIYSLDDGNPYFLKLDMALGASLIAFGQQMEFYFEYMENWGPNLGEGYVAYVKGDLANTRYYLTLYKNAVYRSAMVYDNNPYEKLTQRNILHLSTKPKYFNLNGEIHEATVDCDAGWTTCNSNCEQTYIIYEHGTGMGIKCDAPTSTKRTCMGGDCMPECSERYDAEDNWQDYRGCQSRTEKGRKCQKWTEQFPHQHTESYLVQPMLGDHNYCRNPVGEGKRDRIWCYTTDSDAEWEYCTPKTTRMYTQKNKDTFRYLKICTVEEGAIARPRASGWCENIMFEKGPSKNGWYIYTRSPAKNEYFYLTMTTGDTGKNWVIKNVQPQHDGQFYFEEADPHGIPKSYGIYMLKNGKKQYISMNEDLLITFNTEVQSWAERIVVDFIPDHAKPDPYRVAPLAGTMSYKTDTCQDKDRTVAKMKIDLNSFGKHWVLWQSKTLRSCAAIVRMIIENNNSLQDIYRKNSESKNCSNIKINGVLLRNLCCASCAALDELLDTNDRLPAGTRVFKTYELVPGSKKCNGEDEPDLPSIICSGADDCSADIQELRCESGVATPTFYRGNTNKGYAILNGNGVCHTKWFVWYSCKKGGDKSDEWEDWPEARSHIRPATLIYTKSYWMGGIYRNYLFADARDNLQTSRTTWAKFQQLKGDAVERDTKIGYQQKWYLEDKPNVKRGYIKGSLYVRDPDMGKDYVMYAQHNKIVKATEHHVIRDFTAQQVDETLKFYIEPKGVRNGQTIYHIYAEGEETDTELCLDNTACRYRSYLIAQDENLQQYNEDYRVPLTKRFLHWGKKFPGAEKEELYDHEIEKLAASLSEDNSDSSDKEAQEKEDARDKPLIPKNGEWYFQDISQFTCQCVGLPDSHGKHAQCDPMKMDDGIPGPLACHVVPDVCESDMPTNEHLEYVLSTEPCKDKKFQLFYHEKMNHRVIVAGVSFMEKTWAECREICDLAGPQCKGFNWRYWNLKHVDDNDRNCETFVLENAWKKEKASFFPSTDGWHAYFKITSDKLKRELFKTSRLVDKYGYVTTENTGLLQHYDKELNEWLYLEVNVIDENVLEVACKSLGYAYTGTTDGNISKGVNLGAGRRIDTLDCSGSDMETDLTDCKNLKSAESESEVGMITCKYTDDCSQQTSRSTCNDIIDCKWQDNKGKCVVERGILSRASKSCDRKDIVTNVHVIVQVDYTKLSSGATISPFLCLYSKGKETDDKACSEIHSAFSDNKFGIGSYSKGSNWLSMSYWNGEHICDLYGKVKLKANHMDNLYVKQVVVVVEGKDYSYVAVDPSMGMINKRLGITTTYNDIKLTNEYVWTLEEFGRVPNLNENDETDYVDQVWFAAQTSLTSVMDSKQNPGFIMYANVKFVDEQLYELTGGDQHRGTTSLWTVSNSEETNWNAATISNIDMMTIDHGNLHTGTHQWTFDKHMVIIKSKKGHLYVPSLAAEELKLEPNTLNNDHKSVALKMKGTWFAIEGKKGFQATMKNGYWKYVQRIDSNAPAFTYTVETSTETGQGTEEIVTRSSASTSAHDRVKGVEVCLEGHWEDEGTINFGGCASVEHTAHWSRSQLREDITTTAEESAFELTNKCSVDLACTGASYVTLDNLDWVTANSDACFAWQWIYYGYDEFSKTVQEKESCSFVVIDKHDHTPQCGEGDCDDTTDCQKCLSDNNRQKMCPVLIGVEYQGNENSILKKYGNGMIKDSAQCQHECSKRIACKSWSYYKESTADHNVRDCILFNQMRPNGVNKSRVSSGVNCYKSPDSYKKESELIGTGIDCVWTNKINELHVWNLPKCEEACKNTKDCRNYSYSSEHKSCGLYYRCSLKEQTESVVLKSLNAFKFKRKAIYDSLGQGCCVESHSEVQNNGKGMTKGECAELCTERKNCVAFERKQIMADDEHGLCTLYINKATGSPPIYVQSNQCEDAMCYAKRPEDDPYCPFGYRQVGTTISANVLQGNSIDDPMAPELKDCADACENNYRCKAFTWNLDHFGCKLGTNVTPEGNSGAAIQQRFCARLEVRDSGVFEAESEMSQIASQYLFLYKGECGGTARKGLVISPLSKKECFERCDNLEKSCIAVKYELDEKSCTTYGNSGLETFIEKSNNVATEAMCFQKMVQYKASPCHIIRGANVDGTILETIKEVIKSSAKCGNVCAKNKDCVVWGYSNSENICKLYKSYSHFQRYPTSDAGHACFKIMADQEIGDATLTGRAEIAVSSSGEQELIETEMGKSNFGDNVADLSKETTELETFNAGDKSNLKEEMEVGKEQNIPKFEDEMTSDTPWLMYAAVFAVVAFIPICMNQRNKDPETFSLLEEH